MAKPTEPCLSEEQVDSSDFIFTLYLCITKTERLNIGQAAFDWVLDPGQINTWGGGGGGANLESPGSPGSLIHDDPHRYWLF